MEKEVWPGQPMVMYGVEDLYRHEEPAGPKYLVGVVGVMPFEFIQLENGGMDIIRNFLPTEDPEKERYVYRREHVDWRWAKRGGHNLVQIAEGMLETPGLRWLMIRPYYLMGYAWPEMEEYFPDILSRMKTVLTAVCGDMEFVDERNIEFPSREQVKISNRMKLNCPI